MAAVIGQSWAARLAKERQEVTKAAPALCGLSQPRGSEVVPFVLGDALGFVTAVFVLARSWRFPERPPQTSLSISVPESFRLEKTFKVKPDHKVTVEVHNMTRDSAGLDLTTCEDHASFICVCFCKCMSIPG